VPVIHSVTLNVCDECFGVSPSASAALATAGNGSPALHKSRLSSASLPADNQFMRIRVSDETPLDNGPCSSSALEWLWLARDDDEEEGHLLP
jgi:hypothetical protein